MTCFGREVGSVLSSKLLGQFLVFQHFCFKSLNGIASGFFFTGKGGMRGKYISLMLFIHLAHVLIFRMCLLRVLLLVLDHTPENSSWPIASVEFSYVLFVFYIEIFLT